MSDELDGDHEEHEREGVPFADGPEEMSEVVEESVFAHAHDVGGYKNDEGWGGSGVEVVRWREQARQEGHGVAEEDEEGEGADEGEETLGVLAAHLLGHHVEDGVEEELEEGAGVEALVEVGSEAFACFDDEDDEEGDSDEGGEDVSDGDRFAAEP